MSSQNKYLQFREQYPLFTYEGFSYKVNNSQLLIQFHFHLDDTFHFKPRHTLHIGSYGIDHLSEDMLSNLIFHIGMVELVSYWKAACAPQVLIKPYRLNAEQMQWWKKLYFNGLGEFFYLNNIVCDQDDFMSFVFEKNSRPVPSDFSLDLRDEYIIPVGGGKDSVVTLNLLGQKYPGSIAFAINPREAINKCIEVAGLKDQTFEIQRTIDPELLQLNDKGFLNGHTPFSSLLAFESLLVSAITHKKHIALSNEASANEATIPGTDINHQYSKSYEFEQDFRWYTQKFISQDFNYFSFLRPLNELQIAGLFALQKEYLPVFRSCNAGSKTNSWCCNCPKCLFTYIMLAPFLEPSQLKEVFGENLFEKASLTKTLEQLAGLAPEKPFECVGTINEVNSALTAVANTEPKVLPVLLAHYKNLTREIRFASLRDELTYHNAFHGLKPMHEELLKKALENVKLLFN